MTLTVATSSRLVLSTNTTGSISGALTGYDADGDALTFSLASSGAPTSGTLSIAADRSYTYQPYAGYVGSDTFQYTVRYPQGGTATATVFITVAAEAQYSIAGTSGNDMLVGGTYDNSIPGGTGNDTLIGGQGNDSLYGGVGADSISAGAGDDDISFGGFEVGDFADGGDGYYDVLADVVGGSGGDEITVSGTDFLINGDLVAINFESYQVDGGAGDDVLTGGSSGDTLSGGEGNDRIDGGSGSDTLNVGDGDDTIYDSYGSDTLSGGAGSDVLYVYDYYYYDDYSYNTVTGGDGDDRVFLSYDY